MYVIDILPFENPKWILFYIQGIELKDILKIYEMFKTKCVTKC